QTTTWFVVFSLCILSCWSFVFYVTFIMASLTKELHSMDKTLAKLQWQLSEDQIRLKVKLLSFYERMTSKRMLIGFSASNIFVINFLRFGYMILMYCRFVLLGFRMFI